MKIKLRYWIITIVCCLFALASAIFSGFLVTQIVCYKTLNELCETDWIESDLLVTAYEGSATWGSTDEETTSDLLKFPYIGKSIKVSGKYAAYGNEGIYGSNITVNLSSGEEIKLGSHVTIYFKPDNPVECYYVPVSYTQYYIIIAALVVVDILLIILCRIMNKSLNNNTFNNSIVNIMDLPIVVLICGILLGILVGIIVGNIMTGNSVMTADIVAEEAEKWANLEYSFTS